jgi:uncharacterized alpha-E superfamily protein
MMLSRVADSLYWIGRYGERAEHACRLLQNTITAGMEAGAEEADRAAERALRALGAAPMAARMGSFDEARVLTFSRDPEVSSVYAAIAAARENARQVRDQITTEMWERLNRLYFRVRDADASQQFASNAWQFYEDAIGDLHAFKGIVEGTMSHGEAFRFLSLGRAIERAQLVVRLLELHFAEKQDTVGDYGWVQLLRMCCGLEPYLRAKTANFNREQIADFLVLDPYFPRSLRYCARRIAEHVNEVGVLTDGSSRENCYRLAGRLRSGLDYAVLADVTGRNGPAFIAKVADDCVAISDAVHSAFISYSLEDRLPGGVMGAL